MHSPKLLLLLVGYINGSRVCFAAINVQCPWRGPRDEVGTLIVLALSKWDILPQSGPLQLVGKFERCLTMKATWILNAGNLDTGVPPS